MPTEAHSWCVTNRISRTIFVARFMAIRSRTSLHQPFICIDWNFLRNSSPREWAKRWQSKPIVMNYLTSLTSLHTASNSAKLLDQYTYFLICQRIRGISPFERYLTTGYSWLRKDSLNLLNQFPIKKYLKLLISVWLITFNSYHFEYCIVYKLFVNNHVITCLVSFNFFICDFYYECMVTHTRTNRAAVPHKGSVLGVSWVA